MPTEPLDTVRKSTYDLALLIAHNVRAANLPPEVENHFLQHKDQVIPAIWRGFSLASESPGKSQIQTSTRIAPSWCDGVVNMYKKLMDLDIRSELSKFEWPEKCPQGFNWFIFRPKRLTARMAIDKLCKPQFKVSEHINPDDYTLERDPNQSHVVLCRDGLEHDKEWTMKSADEISRTNLPFLDLCDMAVLEATCYFVFNQYTDLKGYTLCIRSCVGNNVATTCWHQNFLEFMLLAGPRYSREYGYGGREAIVLPRKKT